MMEVTTSQYLFFCWISIDLILFRVHQGNKILTMTWAKENQKKKKLKQYTCREWRPHKTHYGKRQHCCRGPRPVQQGCAYSNRIHQPICSYLTEIGISIWIFHAVTVLLLFFCWKVCYLIQTPFLTKLHKNTGTFNINYIILIII